MYLFKYILKRVALMLMTFFIITTMCYVLIKLLPNLPAEQFGKDMALIMRRRELLGYDLPIPQQYLRFLKYALQGNFGLGETYKLGNEVWKVFLGRLPVVASAVHGVVHDAEQGPADSEGHKDDDDGECGFFHDAASPNSVL